MLVLIAALFGTPASGPAQQPQPAPMPAPPPGTPATLPHPETLTQPTEPPPLPLDYLENLATNYNPILRRDQAHIASARGQAVQAGLFPNPRWDTNNPWVVNGRNSLLNVGLQQEIPVMGKLRLDQAAANENTHQQELLYLQNRLVMLTNVRQQFYIVLADQRRVEVLGQMVELTRRAYETGMKRRQAGDATQTDVLLLQIDYQRTQASLRSAQAILDGDRKQLEAIVGIPGLLIRAVTGQLTGGYPVFDEPTLQGYVANQHTQIQINRSVVEQNQFQLRRAEVEPYPNPTMGPAYQFGLVPGNDQFWFNVTFNIPVWDRNQGNIRAARANVEAAVETVATARNDLLNVAANLLSQYRSALTLVTEFEQRILPNANEAARLVQQGYARGLVDLATYLQAQRTVIQANSDYVDALQSLWVNAAQVAGMLQAEQFPLPWYGPPSGPCPQPQ
jgi:cobalt-zinc-cadmium efflux system outer membrane protein